LSQEFQGHTDFPKALYEVAEPYKKAGESRQAEALYKTIVTNYPDTIHAFKSQKKLTTLYIESGRDAEVQQSFNKMVTNFSKYPDLASALEHIAGKYEMADNLQQAKNIYQKIAIDYPDTDYALQAQKNLGVIYVEEGNDIAAQELIDKLIVDFNDHPALTDAISRIIEGYYYRILESESWLSENYQRPIRMWEKVLKKFPGFFHDEPDLYYFIGDCYRHLGEYENAMQYYGTVAANWTDDGYAVLSQVVVPTAKDDNTAGAYDALHEAIDSLIADFGDHPGLAGVVLRSAHGYRRRANDAQRQGLTGEAAVDNFNAVVLYDRVINEFPSSPFVASSYFFSALAYRDLGQWQDALDCCNRLLDNWPGYKYAPWAQRLAQDCSERLAGQAQ